MENQNNATMVALRDFFLARSSKDLCAACTKLANATGLPAGTMASMDWEAAEFAFNKLITTGGMSVDPDDVTRHGIRQAGVDAIHYGAAFIHFLPVSDIS